MKLRSTLLFAAASLTASALAPVVATTSAFFAGSTVSAKAELATVATIGELVETGDIGTGVVLSTDYTSASTVYTFDGAGAILNIENSSILDYINGGSGYLTIAAWINPEATSGVQSIFGYGAQSDGFKMATNGSTLAFTTKGVADKATLGTITAGEWNLVALTINLSGEYGSKYLIGESDYWTRTLGTWNTPSEANQTFAIGSGNSESNRELFTGCIANLTVAYSESAATNAEVVALLGDAPVIQINTDGKLVWAGTADSNTWNVTATNWLDGEAAAAFTSDADVAFTDTATNKTVALESGVTVTAGDVLVGGSGYVFSTSSGTATLAGKTLTVSKGASLTVGSTKNNTVNLEFENIVLSGKISYNNGDDTWSSLDLAGGELHIYDGLYHGGDNPGVNLTITSATVSKDSTITATWDKSLSIGVLSGSANLSMTGGASGNLTVNVTNLDSYSGTITTNNGSWGLTLNLGAEGKTTTSSANVAVNSGTLNIAGTTTIGTLVYTGNATATISSGTVTIGNIGITANATSSGKLEVESGATLNAASISNGWGLRDLVVDGTLNVSGQIKYTTGEQAQSISGIGKISANTLILGNAGTYNISGVTLEIGSGGVTSENEWGHTTNLGALTVKAASDFSISAFNKGTLNLSDVGEGTVFNTNTHNVTVNHSLSGLGKLVKSGEGILTLSTANAYAGGTTINGGVLVVSNASALGTGSVLVGAGTLSRGMTDSLSIGGDLTAASGAILDLGEWATGTSAITVGGNVFLAEGVVFNIASQTAGTLLSSGGTLSGITSDQVKRAIYIDGVLVNQRAVSATVSEKEIAVSFSEVAAFDLVWNGGESGEWKANGSGWLSGDSDETFQNGDNVTFGANATKTVSIAESLSVGTLVINEDYTFNLANDSVLSGSSLTVADGKTLTLSGAGTISGDVFGTTGTLSIGKEVTAELKTAVSEFSAANITGEGTIAVALTETYTNTINVSNSGFTGTTYVTQGSFQINDAAFGNTLRLAGGVNFQLAGGSTVELSEGKSLVFEGTTQVHQNTLNNIGANLTINGSVTGAGTYDRRGGGTLTFNGGVDLGGFA
ncbi:MAG: autotransporter-associated beta strand repeat-containing protein, partial [Opitutales bacterium]|nr:autotransporter-associated beta strand repeat-containing protein [Opitutales bacterium]